jgi:hypothetical protein
MQDENEREAQGQTNFLFKKIINNQIKIPLLIG